MFARNKRTGALITGTLEVINGRWGIERDSFCKEPAGKLVFDDDGGGIHVLWDSARTARDDHGRIFLDEDGEQVAEADVELARAKGYDVIDDNTRAAWREAGEEVPGCCVCASFGPQGEGDAADLNLSHNRDSYELCDDCKQHLQGADEPEDAQPSAEPTRGRRGLRGFLRGLLDALNRGEARRRG